MPQQTFIRCILANTCLSWQLRLLLIWPSLPSFENTLVCQYSIYNVVYIEHFSIPDTETVDIDSLFASFHQCHEVVPCHFTDKEIQAQRS